MKEKKLEKQLRKLSKMNEFRDVGIKVIYDEISLVQSNYNNLDFAKQRNKHKIKENGFEFYSFDSRTINKGNNQKGRGNYRILCKDGYFYTIAVHRPNSSKYKFLC